MARDANAEARIEHAIREALEGRLSAFDHLPAEDAEQARHRFRERISEAPAGVEFYDASTGSRLR